jgi:inosose dehydratase
MNRTLGCYTNAFGPSGVYAAAELIRSAGLSHLELAMRGHNLGPLVIPESAVVTEKATDAEATAFLDHLRKHDVSISGCNVGGANILTTEGLALTIRRMEFAARWFGVPIVVSGAGQPSDSDERAIMIEHLRQIGDVALRLGQTVALETHKGPTQNASAMLALIDDVNHPQIRLNFDTGNVAYYNDGIDVVAELERVKHLVRNVHLKDSRGKFEDWYFPAIGDGGAIDFRKVREVLDGVGFLGPYTIEIEGIKGEEEPGLAGRLERIKRSVSHLLECGYA